MVIEHTIIEYIHVCWDMLCTDPQYVMCTKECIIELSINQYVVMEGTIAESMYGNVVIEGTSILGTIIDECMIHEEMWYGRFCSVKHV